MSLWMLLLSCWIVGSLPLAVLIGKILAGGQQPSAVPDIDADIDSDIDAALVRIFAADTALRRTP